jgi:diguanylate cyclase (GGDEF)-like protein
LYSLHTGGVVALEALARPLRGQVKDLLTTAQKQGRLAEADVDLAVRAVLEEARQETLLPLHLNLTAVTAAAALSVFDPLLDALASAGKRPREVVLEISAPFHETPPRALLDGMHQLGELGFRLAFDGLGASDLPINLLTDAPIDLVKLDRSTVHRLPSDASAAAIVEALVHYAARTELRLVATGIESEAQLSTVKRLGIRIAQGNLFAPARHGRVYTGTITPATPEPTDQTGPASYAPTSAPRVRDFLRPATTLPATATCEQVHAVLDKTGAPAAIIGLDQQARPQWSIDRTRFLLAVAGPYGHALHAKKPVARLADAPRVIRADAGALELLDLVADADWNRSGDDIVVTDESGRCQGVVLLTEIMRRMAEVKIEEAAALNPLTRLPGSDTVARDVNRRIANQEPLVVAWLDVDAFKQVNDTVGFAAGDDLIRALGRTLTDIATTVDRVTISHVGGDDFLIACDIEDITTVADRLLDPHWCADGMPVTVSLATLVCTSTSVRSYREASRLLAPLKKRAKTMTGSSWANGRPGSEHVEVLRGHGKHTLTEQHTAHQSHVPPAPLELQRRAPLTRHNA